MMDIDKFLTRKCPKYHERTRFYVIMNNGEFPYLVDCFHSNNIDGMVMIDGNVCPLAFQKIDKINDMRFNGRQVNTGMSGTEHIRGYKIFGSGNRKPCIQALVTRLENTGKMNALITVHGVVSNLTKSIKVFINGSFSDVTASREWNIYGPETIEKRRQKEDGSTNFFHKLSIHGIDGYAAHIHGEDISREVHLYPEALNNFQKGEDISNSWDVVKSHFFEQKARCDNRKAGIL